MKKTLLLLVGALVALTASADYNVGQLKYNLLSGGEVECTGFTSTALAQNPTTANIPGRVTIQGTEYRVNSIASGAFKNCTSLRSVYVDWGITAVYSEAFYGCTALYSVKLPSTMATLDTYAFGNCTSMSVFAIAAETPPFVAGSAFSGMKKCNVHVATEAARTTYSASTIWKNIDTDGNVSRTPTLAYDFTASNLYYVIHTGRTVNNYSGKATLVGVAENVTYVFISDATDAFPRLYGGCSSGYTVTMTRIAPYACMGNTKITSVGRSDFGPYTGFEEVGHHAFKNCTALTFAGIPCGTIGDEAFMGCTSLNSVQLYSPNDMANGVHSLGKNAFYGCTSLHELLLYNTNNEITLSSACYGNNASDFKCYVPIHGFYATWYTAYRNMTNVSVEKLNPCIVPQKEWTAISCFKPMSLPSSAQFYYVPDFTSSGSNVVANKQQIIGSVKELQGLLMKATPGTIYRFSVVTTGASPASNYLKAINGNSFTCGSTSEVLENGESVYYTNYTFNPANPDFDKVQSSTTFYSGEAILRHKGSSDILKIYLQDENVPYSLSINGQNVTTNNCNDLTVLTGVTGDQVTYNHSTHTLTLKNATISGNITTHESLNINVVGTNTTNAIWLNGNTYDYSTITGGGTLNMTRPLYSDHELTIKGGTKVRIFGSYVGETTYDYAVDGTSQDRWHYARLTVEGSGTELRLTSGRHLLRSTLTLNDGHYIAKPTATTLKTFDYSTEGGVLVDAYGNELTNTQVLITDAAARGFKHNGLWYEQIASNTAQLIEPQRGENYTGDVVIPYPIVQGSKVWEVTKIDTCAFTGTSVTSVVVPTSVTSIGDKAFYGAKNLKTLVLLPDKAPNKYTLLGSNFAGNNASGFACYVKNNVLLSWLQSYSTLNCLPWVVTNSENGYLPFACARHVTLPDGLTAYSVTGFNASQRMATTTKINNQRIPSKNGVILHGEPGTRYLLPSATSAPAISGNMLRPLLTVDDIPYAPFAANPDDTKAYFLGNSCVEWKEFANNIDLFMSINTGIAYLAVDKSQLGGDYTSPVQLDLWTTATGLRGDIDGNGVVDIDDLNILINIMLGKASASNYPGQADIDGSGSADIDDLNIIINIMLGKD